MITLRPPNVRLSDRLDTDPRRHRAVPRGLPRRYAEPAPLGRLRRQLELAVRAVPDRYRQRAAQRAGRRHQTLHFQRRDCILMNRLIFSSALAALALAAPAAAHGPAASGAPSSPSSTATRSPRTCTPVRRGNTAAPGAGHGLSAARAGARPRRCRPKARRSRPRSTRCRRADSPMRRSRPASRPIAASQQTAAPELQGRQEAIRRNQMFVVQPDRPSGWIR